MKIGYLYCLQPTCEIEVYIIDIVYNYDNIKNKKDIVLIKKIYNPNKVKKKFYNKFKRSLLIENIFSNIKLKDINIFFDKIKSK